MVHAFFWICQFGTVRLVHEISLLFFFCAAVQTSPMWVSACWMIPCERGVHFPMVHQSSRMRRIGIMMVYCVWEWCVLTHIFPPTASGLPVQLHKSVRMFSGCRSETLKECGICLHDCVCVCKKDCYRVWMLRVCWRKLAVREPSSRDWGVRCETCVMFDVPVICYCMCCTPNYSWVSVGLFISIQ